MSRKVTFRCDNRKIIIFYAPKDFLAFYFWMCGMKNLQLLMLCDYKLGWNLCLAIVWRCGGDKTTFSITILIITSLALFQLFLWGREAHKLSRSKHSTRPSTWVILTYHSFHIALIVFLLSSRWGWNSREKIPQIKINEHL